MRSVMPFFRVTPERAHLPGAMAAMCVAMPVAMGVLQADSVVYALAAPWDPRYVSLPVQVLAKSCKMVPVMAAKVMLYDTKYTWREYLMVVLVTTGIVVYRMKANDESKVRKQLRGPGSTINLNAAGASAGLLACIGSLLPWLIFAFFGRSSRRNGMGLGYLQCR